MSSFGHFLVCLVSSLLLFDVYTTAIALPHRNDTDTFAIVARNPPRAPPTKVPMNSYFKCGDKRLKLIEERKNAVGGFSTVYNAKLKPPRELKNLKFTSSEIDVVAKVSKHPAPDQAHLESTKDEVRQHDIKNAIKMAKYLAPHKGIQEVLADCQVPDSEEWIMVTKPLGTDLYHLVKSKQIGIGRLADWNLQLYLRKQMLEITEYIHEKGVTHGDLSENNFMVDSDANVVLIDFATATFKERGRDFASATHVDPHVYGNEFNYKAQDIYALCSVWYFMATGWSYNAFVEDWDKQLEAMSEFRGRLKVKFASYDGRFREPVVDIWNAPFHARESAFQKPVDMRAPQAFAKIAAGTVGTVEAGRMDIEWLKKALDHWEQGTYIVPPKPEDYPKWP